MPISRRPPRHDASAPRQPNRPEEAHETTGSESDSPATITQTERLAAIARFSAINWHQLQAAFAVIAGGFEHPTVWSRYLSTDEGPDEVSQLRQWQSEFNHWQTPFLQLFATAAHFQPQELAANDNQFIFEALDTYERIEDVITKWKPIIEDFVSEELGSYTRGTPEGSDPRFLPIGEEEVETVRSTVAARIGALLSEGVPERLQRQPLLEDVSQRSVQIQLLTDALRASVERARAAGASWNEIGRAAGTTAQAAHRRWDPEARRHHREYVRERYSPAGESKTARRRKPPKKP